MGRDEKRLDKELRFHLAAQVEEYVASGMTREEAERRARLEFGGIEQVKEECRESRAFFWMQTILQDVRYGWRVLRKSPVFTAVAVLSLAIGIGANTAIFSAMDALLLRTLSVPRPGELVMLWKTFPDDYSYTFYLQNISVFENLDAFSGITAIVPQDRSGFATGSAGNGPDTAQIRVALVRGNYFSVMGAGALLGRTFAPEEDSGEGAHPVVVLSHGYWQRKFGGASDVIGSKLSHNGLKYTVIGVMPQDFTGDWVGRPVDLWVPIAMLHQLMPELPKDARGSRLSYRFIARLRPGISHAAAEAAAQVRLMQIVGLGASPNGRLSLVPMARGFSPQRAFFTEPLAILMAMVAALLLVACTNVANLLIARATARRQEIAVRLAIGAGRARIVRQLLIESLLLAVAAGALGAVFAAWGANLLATWLRNGPVGAMSGWSSIDLDLHLDARIFAFNTVLCLLTGVFFGLLPAWRGSHVSLAGALGRRGVDSAPGGRLSHLLVVSQVAVSLAMLAATGLLVRSLHNLRSENLGLDREHLLLVWTLPGQTGRDGPALAALFETAQTRIAGLPGVRLAAPSSYGVLSFNTGGDGPSVVADGYVRRSDIHPRAQFHIVGPGFFDTVGMTFREGRDFDSRDDMSAPKVAIINESMAHFFFPGASAIGRHVQVDFGNNPPLEVIGVVSDAKIMTPRDRGHMMFYYPVRQQVGLRLIRMCMAVRTAGPPASMANAIRQEFRNIDPRLPVLKIDTVDEQLDELLFQEHLIADLAVFFGAVAISLACLGLYGVLSYAVVRRTNEIGIRMALGARRGDVLFMVLRESLLLAGVGIAIGVPAALAAAQFIKNRLWGVGASDPATILGAVLLMLAVAMIAGIIPAHRASKVDPMIALRYE